MLKTPKEARHLVKWRATNLDQNPANSRVCRIGSVWLCVNQWTRATWSFEDAKGPTTKFEYIYIYVYIQYPRWIFIEPKKHIFIDNHQSFWTVVVVWVCLLCVFHLIPEVLTKIIAETAVVEARGGPPFGLFSLGLVPITSNWCTRCSMWFQLAPFWVQVDSPMVNNRRGTKQSKSTEYKCIQRTIHAKNTTHKQWNSEPVAWLPISW